VGRVEVIVIDTHVLVWWAGGVRQVSAAARKAIVDSDIVAFSSVTAWEIGTLARRGRLDIHFSTVDWLREVTETHNLTVLTVTLDIAFRAAELQELLRDPIDCLIAATALAHNAPLITKDDRIRASGVVQTIW
jgi:PIN domain nuclease of toxin-antitoxin system